MLRQAIVFHLRCVYVIHVASPGSVIPESRLWNGWAVHYVEWQLIRGFWTGQCAC